MTASFLPRKWHKWLFLVIGAQMFLWALSGLYMVTVSIDYIHGDHLVKGVKPRISMPSAYPVKITGLIRDFPAATEIRTGRLLGKPVYEIKTLKNSYLVDARSGAKLPPLTRSTIQSVAQALYAGPGAISSLRLLTEKPPSEIRGRPLPLWQVTFNDSSSPTLYISPSTGRLIAKRHDYWRIFDFLWMLHIMDYDNRSDVNNWLLRFSTLAVALAALSGVWLLFYSFSSKKPQPSRSNSPPAARRMQILRPFHKWLGLIIGLQVAVWAISGLVMALLDSNSVQGIDRAGGNTPQTIISGSTIPVIKTVSALNIAHGFYQLLLHRLDNRLIYQISDQNGRRLVDARSGQAVIIGADTARSIAAKDYVGPGTIISAQTVMMPTSDTANARGPAWKIDFNDSRRTTLYISGETGRLIVRRNNIWRVFNFFSMLHFMDYSGRNNFNSPWIIIIAFGAFWLAFSGIILIFKSFSRTEFKAAWMKITRASNSRTLTVLDIYGGLDNKMTAAFGTSVYDSLAQGGITLPSNCGGGGSCGLCRVKFKGQGQPVLEADRRQLCQQELDDGYRLSCQHRLTRDSLVELPQDLLSCGAFEARVIAVRSLTPTIKEITLTLSSGDIFCYQAGSYLLVEIPDDQGHKLTRAYSLATPSQERPTEIVFNIRQLTVPADQPDIPAGIGSGYMCNLTVGDRVNLSGPFGHFAARASDNEMIFIGGGAGMAPLRAIIRDQLLHKKTRRKISFWYGVRNREDIFYQEEFKTLAQQHDNMEFRIGLSEPKAADNWDGPTGFIHKITMEHYLADHPDLSKVEFYLCGPPAMLAATRAMLHDLGIAGEKIVFDDFGI